MKPKINNFKYSVRSGIKEQLGAGLPLRSRSNARDTGVMLPARKLRTHSLELFRP